MSEMGKYYYTDAEYELELNLHRKRRELVLMLEDLEETDCSDCFQIKCTCIRVLKATSRTSESGNSHSSRKAPDEQNKEAPEPTPTPEVMKTEDESARPTTPEKETVIKNIEAWIEASSKAFDEETKPIKINLKESFLQVRKDKKVLKKNYVTHANAVEAFFKYFKVPPTSTNVSYVSAKLAAAYTSPTGRSYSYF